jgi:hypothetical protein
MNWGMISYEVPLEHLPLDVIGKTAGAQTVDRFLEGYEGVARR